MAVQLHRVFDLDGNEIDSFEVDVQDPVADPVDPAAVIESVAAMTDDQKAALRAALGL